MKFKKEIQRFKKSNKKGQAAIEFLMTYGWMLLVVLIVGALIFSFVDFGGLLPSQVDLSPPLRGDNALISASSSNDIVKFVLSYTGARSSIINLNNAVDNYLNPDVGDKCNLIYAKKTTDNVPKCANGYSLNSATNDCDLTTGASGQTDFQVINGELIEVSYKCSSLTKGNVFEGDVFFKVKDSRTQFDKSSKGRVRVTID